MIGINRNESNIQKKVNDMFVSCLGNQTLKEKNINITCWFHHLGHSDFDLSTILDGP